MTREEEIAGHVEATNKFADAVYGTESASVRADALALAIKSLGADAPLETIIKRADSFLKFLTSETGSSVQ